MEKERLNKQKRNNKLNKNKDKYRWDLPLQKVINYETLDEKKRLEITKKLLNKVEPEKIFKELIKDNNSEVRNLGIEFLYYIQNRGKIVSEILDECTEEEKMKIINKLIELNDKKSILDILPNLKSNPDIQLNILEMYLGANKKIPLKTPIKIILEKIGEHEKRTNELIQMENKKDKEINQIAAQINNIKEEIEIITQKMRLSREEILQEFKKIVEEKLNIIEVEVEKIRKINDEEKRVITKEEIEKLLKDLEEKESKEIICKFQSEIQKYSKQINDLEEKYNKLFNILNNSDFNILNNSDLLNLMKKGEVYSKEDINYLKERFYSLEKEFDVLLNRFDEINKYLEGDLKKRINEIITRIFSCPTNEEINTLIEEERKNEKNIIKKSKGLSTVIAIGSSFLALVGSCFINYQFYNYLKNKIDGINRSTTSLKEEIEKRIEEENEKTQIRMIDLKGEIYELKLEQEEMKNRYNYIKKEYTPKPKDIEELIKKLEKIDKLESKVIFSLDEDDLHYSVKELSLDNRDKIERLEKKLEILENYIKDKEKEEYNLNKENKVKIKR